MNPAITQALSNTLIQFIHTIPIGVGAMMVSYAIGLNPHKHKFWMCSIGLQLLAAGIINATT